MKNKLLYLFLLLSVVAGAQIVNIPDANFKATLLQANSTNGVAKNSSGISMVIDTNSDGNIQVSEALNVYELSIGGQDIFSLTGIESFTNLTYLFCIETGITNVDVTMLHDLQILSVSYNSINSINISGLQDLEELYVSGNALTQISTSGCTSLKRLVCEYNDVSVLDISDSYMLTRIECSGTLITVLDISNQINLSTLLVFEIPTLTEVYMKNGNINELVSSTFYHCPNLQLICADEGEIESLINLFSQRSEEGAEMYTTYCTATPGGNFNTITGTIKFDSNNNGCDTSDALNNFVRIDFSNGMQTGVTFTNASGNYNLYVQDGSFLVAPQMENDWFTVSPQSASVTFADNNNNTQTQDFCITANGIHPDIEVVLVPIVAAQPGFDAKYKIVYKNKGNQVLSGDITLTYNDVVTDFVSANPVSATSQSGSLAWNYSSLMPFESREITFTLNVNSPMETPAVNIDDVLAFTVGVTPPTGDETPQDNTFTLNQIVVGSYDPNDITCLEGETVSDTKIGEYLHYNINFENTGTAPATFIVVKDMIDVTKYDVTTLQLLNASHEVMANVSGNKAEFRFDNINLGAQQKGNLVFKIKTLGSLALNDAVMNEAEIFFDYNFPVETNQAITTFTALSTGDFIKDATVKVYPNPTNGLVNLKANSTINTIELFDIQGKLLQTNVVNNADAVLNLSAKQSGIYFVRITTDKGMSIEKIVRQ